MDKFDKLIEQLDRQKESLDIQERMLRKQNEADEKIKLHDFFCKVTPSLTYRNYWQFCFFNDRDLPIKVLKISAKTYFDCFGIPTNYGLDDTHMKNVNWKESLEEEIIIRNIPAASQVCVDRPAGGEIAKFDRQLDFWMKMQVGYEGDSFPMRLVRVVVKLNNK